MKEPRRDPGIGGGVGSYLFCRVQWLPSIVLPLGQAWHLFFQRTQGWHSFQAGIYFFLHIKITKLKGDWGMCVESGYESLFASPVGTREQISVSDVLVWLCCFWTVLVLFEGLRKSL